MLRLVSLALVLGFASLTWGDGHVVLSSGRVMSTKDVSRLVHEIRVKDPKREQLNADSMKWLASIATS
jgi:hypothetical protein